MPEPQIADSYSIHFVRAHLGFADTQTTARYIALNRGRDEAIDSEDHDG